MADLLQLNNLFHFPSHFRKSRFSLHNISPFRRKLSLVSNFSSPFNSSSPNLLIISTSVELDGSLVFKFGDASEIPPVVEKVDDLDTISNDSEIETVSDDSLVISNVENKAEDDIEDEIPPVVEKVDVLDTISGEIVVKSEIESDHNVEDDIEDEIPPVVDKVDVLDTISGEIVVKSEIESDHNVEDDIEDEIPPVVDKVDVLDTISGEIVMKSEVEIDHNVEILENNVEDVIDDEIPQIVDKVDVLDTISNDFEIEVELETKSNANDENDAEDVIEVKDSSIQVSESEKIEGENNRDDLVVVLEVEDFGVEDSKVGVINESGSDVKNLNSELALEDDEEIDEEEIAKDRIIEDDVYGMVVPLEGEKVVDEEVNDVGVPSIAQLEDSPTGDDADAAFSSLEEPVVTSTEAIFDRDETSSHNGDISALSLSMSSASTSLSLPSTVNDGVPSSFPQSDDNTESRYISEPANLDSVQLSTVSLSVPSATSATATVPLPEAIEVNDAAIPSIQQSDDLCSDSYVSTHPGSGIAATTEISIREEISAPSLCVVSAAASLAQSAEALAGGDDAYFVCENWFGVADGVGQWSFGGIDKGFYALEFIQNCERLARESLNTGLNNLKELLQQSASMTESSGAARVLIAHIADQVLHVANIGDSGFIVIRNGTVLKKSTPMFHEFNFPYAISSGDNPVESLEEYHVELEEGDIIVTATDGLFDNIYEREIASLVRKAVEDGSNVKDIAELLAFRSQEVGRSRYARTPFADAAQEAGYTEFSGGKFDHVTVIVSVVQKE